LLYELAEQADPRGCIVEIGSWQGRSTICLAAGAKVGHGARVFAIDPHAGTVTQAHGQSSEAILRKNLDEAGVAEQVEVVVATSQQAASEWRAPISLLWIDGDHSYDGTRQDYLLWSDRLVDGGVIAFHDTFTSPGPARVLSEYVLRSEQFTRIGFAGEITFALKRNRFTTSDRIRRRIELLRRSLYGLRLRTGLPARLYFFVRSREQTFRRLRAVKARLTALRRPS
jgi:predicted O-methyltransferase YrrM